MVGEIRDLETAEIAVQASLTGHMVMSTLHTNTAVGAVTRLMDMGVEPFLLSSSLVAYWHRGWSEPSVKTVVNQGQQQRQNWIFWKKK